MNIIHISRGTDDQPAIHQLRIQGGADATAAARAVHLLVLDIRGMRRGAIDLAFDEVGVVNRSLGFNHGILLCDAPTLPITVAAIRAGLRDLAHGPISARRLRSIVQQACPAISVGTFRTLAALLRSLDAKSVQETPAIELARREQALAQRSEQLANIERRLAFDRAALEERDRELRASARRLERELAAQQLDQDRPAAPPAPAAAELQTLAQRLAQRAAELDFREKLLLEMQALLTAQADVRAPVRL